MGGNARDKAGPITSKLMFKQEYAKCKKENRIVKREGMCKTDEKNAQKREMSPDLS